MAVTLTVQGMVTRKIVHLPGLFFFPQCFQVEVGEVHGHKIPPGVGEAAVIRGTLNTGVKSWLDRKES